MDVNFFGQVNTVQAFVPKMLQAASKVRIVICVGSKRAVTNTPGGLSKDRAIICVGSKQGITTPPGATSYNVSKAAVKSR